MAVDEKWVKRTAAALLAAGVILFLLAMLLGARQGAAGSGLEENDLYREAVAGLDDSARAIDNVTMGGSASNVPDPGRLRGVEEEITRYYEKLLSTPGARYEDVARSESMKHIASAAYIASSTADDYEKLRGAMDAAVSRLENLDIRGALSIYNATKPLLENVTRNLTRALRELEKVDPNTLTPEEREKYEKAKRAIERALEMLEKYRELMEETMKHRDAVEKLAMRARGADTPVTKGEAGEALTMISRVGNGLEKLGTLAPKAGNYLAKIASEAEKVLSEEQGETGSSHNNEGGQGEGSQGQQAGGTGAGYGGTSSDD